ncbi:hypothetical protein Hypma_014648 [Hypsizygus marmoreus]|uniref:F-box domain-containing protein n=1 Tax=Hypsizygus marmoreus TaxID=39966 RepID=A0A369JG89_HYPMA|nr:hypothetical protein Hypma_014648 [Hypsizygus marmoreus]
MPPSKPASQRARKVPAMQVAPGREHRPLGEREMDLYRIPNEMWIAVFEAMGNPSDLFKVILTCKHFYALAIRVLYRDMQWTDPFLFASNSRFWEHQDQSMFEVPRSLKISLSLMNPNPYGRYDPSAIVVEPDGTYNLAMNNISPGMMHLFHHSLNGRFEPKRVNYYASPAMYDAITTSVSSFTMLRELIFHNSDLPYSIFTAIKSLRCLRHLSIQNSILPLVRVAPDPTLSELPITELTLWSNKGDSDMMLHSNHTYILYLCTAKHLRTLRIDWNSVTGRFLSLKHPAHQVELPTSLVDVTLRFPSTKIWPAEGEETRYPIDPLGAFLSNSPGIKRLTVINRRVAFDFPLTVLPNLDYYIGPFSTVLSILTNRPVRHLEITDFDRKLDDFVHILPIVAEIKPTLQTLCVFMRGWDDEILFALTTLFSDLRKIRIKYETGYPSEQTLLSLGAQFLYRFPRLETLHIYQAQPPAPPPSLFENDRAAGPSRPRSRGPQADPRDQEVKELILPWKRHCPYLREVQVVEDSVWRRAFDGDEWCKRPLQSDPADKYNVLH